MEAMTQALCNSPHPSGREVEMCSKEQGFYESQAGMATPPEVLEAEFMNPNTPINEAGHWARREITQLRQQLATANAEIEQLTLERDAAAANLDSCASECLSLRRSFSDAENRIAELQQELQTTADALGHATLEGYDGIAHDMEKLRFGLENCRLLAARNRKEVWALLILGFCAEAGVTGSITR
jgi:hypothetical protein